MQNQVEQYRFNTNERREILQFVRRVIQCRLLGIEPPVIPDNPKLQELGSCFVTIRFKGALRGCIGNIGAAEPLGNNL